MKIATRIFLGFGTIIVLLGLLAALNYRISQKSRRDIGSVREQFDAVSEIHALDRELQSLQRTSLMFASDGNPAVATLVDRHESRFDAVLERIEHRLKDDEQRVIVDKLREFLTAYREAFGRLVEDRGRRDSLYEASRSLARKASSELERLTESAGSRSREAFARADRALLNYVERPDSALIREMKSELRTAKNEIPPGRSDDITATLGSYEQTALQMVQAIRGYLFLSGVVLAGIAAEFSYYTELFRSSHAADASDLLTDLTDGTGRTGRNSIAVALAALIVGLLLAGVVGRSIARPVTKLTATFSRLARGEQVESIPGAARQDELGEMAAAAQIFNERNRQTEQLLESAREQGRILSDQAHQLSRANEELEQFAYVASHDLQEPLRMVASYVQLLGEEYRGKLDEDADEYIGFASEGAARMQILINDLLDLSRLGRGDRAAESIDTQELIESIAKDLEKPIADCGLEIVAEDLPVVHGFANPLRQAFQNFISNAAKYHGDAPPRLEITAERSDDGWHFAFRDNGIGLDPRHSERIFKIFQRLHNRTEYAGSGMGLAIVKKAAEQHRGRVWVESAQGEGACFHFVMGEIET